jgi:PKD repeat protein
VLGDTPKPQRKPKAQAGRLTLGLGDVAGTTIVGETQAGEPQQLAQALANARRELSAAPTRAATLEHDAEHASGAMLKVQEVLGHFTEIAEGRIDAETLGNWADQLIGSLKGLDPDEHWQERLRVLRTLVVLLALLGRWLELAQSLSDALQAAERLGDGGARAWAMHELGTLHLAAEQHAEADDYLSHALQLRAQAKYEAGVKATEANLRVLCKMLRSQLHQAAPADEQPPPGSTNGERRPSVVEGLLRRPLPLLVLGLAFLAVGDVAGAAISGQPSVSVRRLAVVIESVPAVPQIDERVVFRAVVENRADPDHYSWLFGDGEGASSAHPAHVYLQPGSYTVTVAVSDSHGTAAGEAARTVIVRGHPSVGSSAPTGSFKQTNKTGKSVKPAFTSATTATFAAGTTERLPVTATGEPTPTITESGTLPSGVRFVGSALSGAPNTTSSTPETFPLTFTATNSAGSATQSFTLTVVAKGATDKPQITSPESTTFTQRIESSFTVTASGTPTPTITESGTLPGGVVFNAGALTGAPTTTSSTAETFPLTFTATNSAGSTTQSFTLTVQPQPVTIAPQTTTGQPPESKPTITSAESTTFKYGREERFPVKADGAPTPTITSEGKLPEGVEFDEGALIGAARRIGNFPLTFTASNKAGSAVQTFMLKVIE